MKTITCGRFGGFCVAGLEGNGILEVLMRTIVRLKWRNTIMAKILKVHCTGPERHENEINLDDIIGEDVVIYGGPIATGRDLPARVVRRCEICDQGKVIVTREMIEENL
jgi:hypothetical protein